MFDSSWSFTIWIIYLENGYAWEGFIHCQQAARCIFCSLICNVVPWTLCNKYMWALKNMVNEHFRHLGICLRSEYIHPHDHPQQPMPLSYTHNLILTPIASSAFRASVIVTPRQRCKMPLFPLIWFAGPQTPSKPKTQKFLLKFR